jgi:hypothetical protein
MRRIHLYSRFCYHFAVLFSDDDGTLLIFYLNDPSFLKGIMGFLSSNKFKIQQKWCMVNTSLKLSSPRDLLKMVFLFLPFNFFSFWLYFKISMQDVPIFHLDINLGPCVHFNFSCQWKFFVFICLISDLFNSLCCCLDYDE